MRYDAPAMSKDWRCTLVAGQKVAQAMAACAIACAVACGGARNESPPVVLVGRDELGIAFRDEVTGVRFALEEPPQSVESRTEGAVRHLEVLAGPAGARFGQRIDVVSIVDRRADPSVLVGILTSTALRRGRIVERGARFHLGHPAMVLRVRGETSTTAYEDHVLIVSVGSVAAMLTHTSPLGATDDVRTSRFFESLRFAGDPEPRAVAGR